MYLKIFSWFIKTLLELNVLILGSEVMSWRKLCAMGEVGSEREVCV